MKEIFKGNQSISRLDEKCSSVAIIVPVHNAEPYLRDCLNSILAQTYGNFTVIAVDDGSQDNSGLILDDYANRDGRIHVVHIANGGVSAARNKGLEEVENNGSYDYVAMVDADDYVSKNMLEVMTSAAIQRSADVVVCAFLKFNDSGRTYIEGRKNPHQFLSKEDFISLIFASGKYKKICGAGGMVWKYLVKASAIKGLRFDEDRGICEDELFSTGLALRAENIFYIPETLYFYRDRARDASHLYRFDQMLLEGRYRAFLVGEKISDEAAEIIAASYMKTLLSLAKKAGKIDDIEVTIPPRWARRALKSGLIDRKKVFLIVIMKTCPVLFSLYCDLRQKLLWLR